MARLGSSGIKCQKRAPERIRTREGIVLKQTHGVSGAFQLSQVSMSRRAVAKQILDLIQAVFE